MNHLAHTEHNMQACIEACSHCHQVCLQTSMNHCLDMGGKHIEADHFRLMMSCAEVCEACAVDCETIGGMDECADACKACTESCREMAGMSDRAPISGFYPD